MESTMEHRWGQRVSVSLPVRLMAAADLQGSGILRDISASGGFIETDLRVPILSQLELELPNDDSLVSAFVVRRTQKGMAVEWEAMAPDAILCLLAGPHQRARVRQHPWFENYIR